MPAKRILLVDDHRDTTRMLRATLETLGGDYVIVDVPSGEEAVLEIGRGGIDLLITDVYLPGMSGLDVIKRLQKIDPKTKTIVISGKEAGSEAAQEAERLGAVYFTKPLRMDDFIKAAQSALGEPPQTPAKQEVADDQPGIANRVSALRRDLGANAVFLVNQEAQIVVQAGDVPRLDTGPALAQLMAAFSAGMKLCKLLGGLIPSNVHFFDGDDYDIYAANVGQYFALVIIFDGDRGSSQMGPVLRYGRQCADDLLNSLVMMGVTPEPADIASLAAAPAETPAAKPGPEIQPVAQKAAPPEPKPEPEPPPKPLAEEELKALDQAMEAVSSADAASFWDSALEEAEETDVRPDALSWEQAEKLGLIPKD